MRLINEEYSEMYRTITRTICFMICFITIMTVFVSFNTAEAEAASKPATVKMSSCKCFGSWINIYWKKAKRAKKYEVWVKEGDRPFKKVKTLTGKYYGYTRKIADEAKVRIKVRGINGKVKGSFSKIKTITEFKIAGVKGQTITEEHGPFKEEITVEKILTDYTIYGRTQDGIDYSCEKHESGIVIVRIGAKERTGDGIFVEDKYCSFDFNPFFVTFERLNYFSFKSKNDSGYSVSWSNDGQEPEFRQGNTELTSYQWDKYNICINKGRFDTGRIPQLSYETIVRGSSDGECDRMALFPLFMEEGMDESRYASRYDGGLCDGMINDNHVSFIDYIEQDYFRDPPVISERNLDNLVNENGPVNAWFRIFDKTGKRKAEFLAIIPEL